MNIDEQLSANYTGPILSERLGDDGREVRLHSKQC